MKTILIIDDETDLCDLLKMALSRYDFKVDCAFNLSEAEEKLKKHPKIILLDNSLPDGTGLDYLRMHRIEFIESYVIMISADANPLLEQTAIYEGIDAFIQKPFSLRAVKQIILKVA